VPSRSGASLTPWLGIAFIVILLDQISKITITRTFMHGEEKPSPASSTWCWRITRAPPSASCPTRAAGSATSSPPSRSARSVFIIYLLRKHAGQRMFCWALALIMGGALGNLIDRLMYGHVIDFLDFHLSGVGHFPAFNIADTAITIGAILFIFDELRRVNKH
jgi:signal peptidase II